MSSFAIPGGFLLGNLEQQRYLAQQQNVAETQKLAENEDRRNQQKHEVAMSRAQQQIDTLNERQRLIDKYLPQGNEGEFLTQQNQLGLDQATADFTRLALMSDDPDIQAAGFGNLGMDIPGRMGGSGMLSQAVMAARSEYEMGIAPFNQKLDELNRKYGTRNRTNWEEGDRALAEQYDLEKSRHQNTYLGNVAGIRAQGYGAQAQRYAARGQPGQGVPQPGDAGTAAAQQPGGGEVDPTLLASISPQYPGQLLEVGTPNTAGNTEHERIGYIISQVVQQEHPELTSLLLNAQDKSKATENQRKTDAWARRALLEKAMARLHDLGWDITRMVGTPQAGQPTPHATGAPTEPPEIEGAGAAGGGRAP